MSLTWNRDWILPYESLWSLFEKIKYANQINTKQLLQTFGTNDSKKIKTGKVSKRHRNINLIEGLDVDLLEKSIGLNIEKNKNNTLQLIHRFIPHILQTKNLLNENLVYCRECLNSGLYKPRGDKEFPEICPYAYAYIFWKESFYDINPFYNEVAPRKKRGLKNVELPFFYNNDSVKVAINYILKNFGEKINVKALSWIIKHMVWNVAKNHFQNWTVIAKENAAKSIRPKTKYDNFNFADLFSFVINENDSIVELYISKNDVEGNITGLICPYREKKYKVNRDDEISHLPMRLAINPGFKNEKIAAEKYLARLKVISFVK